MVSIEPGLSLHPLRVVVIRMSFSYRTDRASPSTAGTRSRIMSIRFYKGWLRNLAVVLSLSAFSTVYSLADQGGKGGGGGGGGGGKGGAGGPGRAAAQAPPARASAQASRPQAASRPSAPAVRPSGPAVRPNGPGPAARNDAAQPARPNPGLGSNLGPGTKSGRERIQARAIEHLAMTERSQGPTQRYHRALTRHRLRKRIPRFKTGIVLLRL